MRCPNGKGGLSISTWDDLNFDDTYTATIDKDFAQRSVCNGDKGDSGANSLVTSQPIAAGSTSPCSFGGIKVSSGVDANKNAVLDAAEAAVSYVCNGIKGDKGEEGAKGDQGAGGAPAVVAQKALGQDDVNCPSGGVAIESFTDNGSLTAERKIGAPDGQYTAGIDSNYQPPNFICNGRAVSVATKVIEGSDVCPAGGLYAVLYRDNNGNGNLDGPDNKVSITPICNGMQGAPGKSTYVRLMVLAPQSSECPTGGIMLETGTEGEVAGVKFSPPVCNGANGVINVMESAVGCGIVGGKTFQSFTDINNNGTYEKGFDLNYKETEVCNGNSKMVEELMAQLLLLREKMLSQENDLANVKLEYTALTASLKAQIAILVIEVTRLANDIARLQALLKAMIADFEARGDAFTKEILELQALVKQLQALLPPTSSPLTHHAFLTGSFAGGMLGGISGADKKCQDAASNAGLTGKWAAIISTSRDDAVVRIKINGPVYDFAGNLLAKDRADFWRLSNPMVIAFDAGGNRTSPAHAWTGMKVLANPYGSSYFAPSGADCGGWGNTYAKGSYGRNFLNGADNNSERFAYGSDGLCDSSFIGLKALNCIDNQ